MINIQALRKSLLSQKQKTEFQLAQVRDVENLLERKLERITEDINGLEESTAYLKEKRKTPRVPQDLVEACVREVLAEGGDTPKSESAVYGEVRSRIEKNHPELPLHWLARQFHEVLSAIGYQSQNGGGANEGTPSKEGVNRV